MIDKQHWAACQVITGLEHMVRAEIEAADYGAFLPTYARCQIRRGKLWDRELPLLPGYVMFRTPHEGWGQVGAIKGVLRVLADGHAARAVDDLEVARLMIDHAAGVHNVRIYARNDNGQFKRKRSRKPRPGNRIRKATCRNVTEVSLRIPKSFEAVHVPRHGDVGTALSTGQA